MPGQTNNSTILQAENQEIVALNEIRAAVENLSTPTVAIDLSGLETAITVLGATLSNALENLNMNITQTNNCGCCGGASGGGTSTPPTTPPFDPGSGGPGSGGPGDPPGDGQTDPPGTPTEIAARRCKMAVWLVDEYLTGIAQQLDLRGVDTLINAAVIAGAPTIAALTTGFIVTIIAAAIGLVVTPGPTPDDLFTAPLGGFIAAIVTYLIVRGGTVDFASLVEFLQENRVGLICALNSAQYAAGARIAFFNVVDSTSPNLEIGNRNFLDKMMALPILMLLFYADKKYLVLENYIAEQPDECPCGDVDPTETTPTDEYKCQAANYIFDSFTDTIANFGGVSTMSWYSVASFISALGSGLLSNMFAGLFGLLFTALTTIIPAIISYLGRLYWKGTAYFEPFSEIAAQFQANKEAIICELYEAEDVAAARAALEVHISDYVGSVMTANPEWADEQQTYIDTVTSLLPNAVLNELFKTGAEERPEISGYNPPDFYDCQCGADDGVIVWDKCRDVLVPVNPDGQTFTVEAVPGGCETGWVACYVVWVRLGTTETGGWPEPIQQYTLNVQSGAQPNVASCRAAGGSAAYLYLNANGDILVQGGPSPFQCCNQFVLMSNNPFTITFNLGNECP